MNKLFYPKLAVTNIKKNGKFYFPYILTCVGTVMIFYLMCFLSFNEGIKNLPGASAVQLIMGLGCIIVGIFASIFLFYTNSFLTKRRKKEFGLYNILGMEKRHLGKMMAYESFFVGFFSIAVGILCGIIFSKLSVMILAKLLWFDTSIGFEISAIAIIATIILFGIIFLAILISNLARIHLSNPIELLKGSNVGEKEPKTKWILTIVGLICTISGYWMAMTVEAPLTALTLFFVAVVLVIIGTYCLFTSGSIALLKLLRKNKRFYYKTKNFTAVSGMIYRMKQNAVGISNICILSTMVLVVLSTTISLYVGIEDVVSSRVQNDIEVFSKFDDYNAYDSDAAVKKVDEIIQKNGGDIKLGRDYLSLSFSAILSGKEFLLETGNYYASDNVNTVFIITAEEYDKIMGTTTILNEDEVMYFHTGEGVEDSFFIGEKEYMIKEKVDEFPQKGNILKDLVSTQCFVVANENVMMDLYNIQFIAYEENLPSKFSHSMVFDLNGTDEEKLSVYNKIEDELRLTEDTYVESKQSMKQQGQALYGGFLFMGLFLGSLFIMATVLIMYYKQISEGYDDKQRFDIMQKVGMSKSEIKKSINSQILLVFFSPLVVACIHVAGSFNMMTKLLELFSLSNVNIFLWCTLGTILCFAVIYAIVYALTARVYYKIIQ